MVVVSVSVHPLASVAVTVYVPAVRPVAVAVVAPVLHTKVLVPVPPEAEAVADPVDPPLHSTFEALMLATTAVGCVTARD